VYEAAEIIVVKGYADDADGIDTSDMPIHDEFANSENGSIAGDLPQSQFH